MARRSSNETTSDLYIRLGLSLDELESGFVDAERTIRDNMSRLHRENMIIDMQMKVELTGLDKVADADRILEIKTAALNKQLANQRDRVRLAAAELRNMTERTGENSVQTQRARLTLEHHRLVLAQLEDQLAHLNDAEEETTEETMSALDAFDAFARQCWNVIGIAMTVGNAITSLVDHFRELQTQAYELNLPVNDAEAFLRHMRLAGGDIEDIGGYIRGITDAFVKGEYDDPEFLALDKYGAKIIDATGRLKNFQDITEEVYQAWKKADAAGEGIEFLQLTGGESGITDAIQYFQRYEEAKEDAEKIFDAGLDPDELHEADRALNLLTEQLGEFMDAIVNVAIVDSTEAFKQFFEVIRAGTEFLVENKEALRDAIVDPLTTLPFVNLGKQFFELRESLTGIEAPDFFFSIGDLLSESDEAVQEATKSWADFKKEVDQAPIDANPLSQYALTRIKDFKDELEELRIELDYADNEYQQALAKLELWKKNELTDKLFVSDDERIAIEELYSAKLEQIEQERADKLDEIREKIAEGDRTALENKLASIEQEKEAWVSAGMEEAEAVALAEQQKNDAVLALEQEFEQARNALGQTGLQNALARIEQEKQAWIQKGIDEVQATTHAEQQKAQVVKDLYQQFAMAIIGLSNNTTTKALANIDMQKQSWIDKGISEVDAEKWASLARDNIYQQEEKARRKREQEEKRAREQEVAQEQEAAYQKALANYEFNIKLAESRHADLQNALDRIEQEKQAWIQKGIDEARATELAEQQKANAMRNAALAVLKQQIKEWRIFQKEGYEGLKKYQLNELYKQGISPQDLQMTPEQLRKFDQARDVAQRNLLPNFSSAYDKRSEQLLRQYGSTFLRDQFELNPMPRKPKKKKPADDNDVEDESNATNDTAIFKLLNQILAEFNAQLNQLKTSAADAAVQVPVDTINAQLTQINMPVDGLNQQLNQLEVPVDKLNSQLDQLHVPADKPALPLDDINTQLRQITLPIEALNNQLAQLNVPVDKLNAQLAELTIPTAAANHYGVSEDSSSFDAIYEKLEEAINEVKTKCIASIESMQEELQKSIDNVSSTFAVLDNYIALSSGHFAILNEVIPHSTYMLGVLSQEVQALCNTIVGIINRLGGVAPSTPSNSSHTPVQANITNNVSINEAHAWDTGHINELANRVAKNIKDALVDAIGGDDIAY